MAIYKYRPYYKFTGPTNSNPLLDELSDEVVERNLRLVVDDLENHFGEIGGTVDSSEVGVVCVTTSLPEKECDEIVASYLTNLYLLADKVSAQ